MQHIRFAEDEETQTSNFTMREMVLICSFFILGSFIVSIIIIFIEQLPVPLIMAEIHDLVVRFSVQLLLFSQVKKEKEKIKKI